MQIPVKSHKDKRPGREAGFTLIETLISLTILALVIAISAQLMFYSFEKLYRKQFLTLLDSDILYVQNQAMGSVHSGRLYFQNDYYYVLDPNGPLKERYYPKDLSIQTGNKRINYNFSGNITEPRTISIRHHDERMQMVFPFGKGRFYVRE